MGSVLNLLFRKFYLTIASIVFVSNMLVGQSLQHPHIWVSDSDKHGILDNINNYEWAEGMFNQLKQRNEDKKDVHLANPEAFLSNITTIPGDRDKHREDLNTAAECAVLYYLTGDEGYAQFAADILHHYVKMISPQDPLTIRFFNPDDKDSHHIMTREDFPRIAIVYDFIYPFISKADVKVYDLDAGNRVAFAYDDAQKSFEVMAENVLKVGGGNSNHPLLELAGGLYSALCIADDAVRQDYYYRFWHGDTRQNGMDWMLEHFAKDGDIWPESVGYSKGVHDIMLRIMNVVDRYDPAANIISDNLRLLDGAFVFENFKYPNNAIMAYGDSHRDESATDHIIRYVHTIAHRKGLTDYEVKAASVLKAQYVLQGGYKPEIKTERLNWDTPLELLWGVNVADTVSANSIPLYTTIQAKYAGVVMQRNYVSVNNEDYGLMYYTGGGTYVHAHASGLDMEFYGAGYVIAPDYGRNVYSSDIHEQYVVSPAAHNTVVVNGITARGPKTNGAWTWQNIVAPIQLLSSEPKVKEDPISSSFCFSTQYLNDIFNKCHQMRSNYIVRTSPTTGYYVDIFRSISKYENNFHDYLFHGLGDAMSIKSKGNAIQLTNTSGRYQNDIGDSRKQPGWRWFSQAKTSAATVDPIAARFDLNASNKYLHLNVPAGTEREYTSALAPPTPDVKNGYDKKDTRVFIMRKYGEAWDQPFVAVYEPSGNAIGSVKSVENLIYDEKVVGVKVVSQVDNEEIIDYVISLPYEQTIQLPEHFIKFTGLAAVVRRQSLSESTEQVTLYIGDGTSLSYADLNLDGGDEKKNVESFTGVQKITSDTKFAVSTNVLGGGGTITKTPEMAEYPAGTQVVVTAVPDYGNVIDQWLGDASGSRSTDTLTLFTNKNVMARFRIAEFYGLEVEAENGVITQSDSGNDFPEQSCVELEAVPDEGYEFDSWSGDVVSDENPITVCFDANKNITANFKLATSIDEKLSNSISIYPNPSNRLFRVVVNEANNYKLYNIQGEIVKKGSADGLFVLDLKSLKRSVYFLNIQTINGNAMTRIILK